MKTKTKRQPKARRTRQPYDGSTRSPWFRTESDNSTTDASQATSAPARLVHPFSIPSTVATSATGALSFRDFCVHHVKTHYPDVEPRNDWELTQMTMKPFEGSADEVYAALDKEYIEHVKMFGFEEVNYMGSGLMDTEIEPTGVKPPPKELNKYIHVRPIPDTQYSLRLFPGSISAREYCMDIVDSASGEPVNSPFDFELWGAPDPATPAVGMPRLTHQIPSAERGHGLKQEEIQPGHEKWFLTDGRTYVIVRPEKPNVRFTVPDRRLPRRPPPPDDEIVLDLPKVVD